MAVNWSNALQGLGAMALAFGDPARSLMLSQNIFQNNAQARERKERELRQARQLALQEERLRFEQVQAQQAQAQLAAGQQQLAGLFAPGAGAGIVDPMEQALQQAVMLQARTNPAAAAKMYLDYRTQAAERRRLAAAPHALIQRAQAATALTPEQRAALQALAPPQASVQVNLADQAAREPGRYHPIYGEAGPRKAWALDAQGNPITRTVDVGGGVMAERPVLIDAEAGVAGIEETKTLGLVQTGLESIQEMRNILRPDAATPPQWDNTMWVQYQTNLSGTPGGELKRFHLDAGDTLSKLRTGAAMNDSEKATYRAIYGFSPLHSPEDVDARLRHLERSIDVYKRVRDQENLNQDEPLPPDALAAADDQALNNPSVNPYAREGLNFIGHHPGGEGVVYEVDGQRIFMPYLRLNR